MVPFVCVGLVNELAFVSIVKSEYFAFAVCMLSFIFYCRKARPHDVRSISRGWKVSPEGWAIDGSSFKCPSFPY